MDETPRAAKRLPAEIAELKEREGRFAETLEPHDAADVEEVARQIRDDTLVAFDAVPEPGTPPD